MCHYVRRMCVCFREKRAWEFGVISALLVMQQYFSAAQVYIHTPQKEV